MPVRASPVPGLGRGQSHFSQPGHFEKFLRLGRLHYEDNISSPEFVPTSDQCADIWTKALDKTTFLKHRAKLVRWLIY
ncbi:hypothetical protein EMIHUDRAFT_217839 [Emiliania huxleyi CCMP1516]|uniref:Uncharacterized protein n=2 Tax=Emiliania huxleyi TaxID=2903 RepID=A0A0D3IAE9_EMIH1|nr:hypothetical protein EMIHUDRAFT_217839 [Emiliania huxleyi CCMP1516]EOD08234.1 hypothetical protein EMIHUDRAFT_217839 [Emiliania huxleyi CCMP1516]|eukprot:XP_005760663.1 hypothetical protein EMIHUDRAFT_217839 [Emiliania huxleyi CCMP1516]